MVAPVKRRAVAVALVALALALSAVPARPVSAEEYFPGGEMGELRNTDDTRRFFDFDSLMEWVKRHACRVLFCKKGGIS